MAMTMNGEVQLAAPREAVWAKLNDPEVLKVCIPGCEELEKTDDNGFRAVAKMKVGPVSARFKGKVTLSDLDPPNGYKISGEGEGGVAGFAKGGAKVRLEDSGSDTLLRYEVHAQVGGKIAQLGARLIDATAKQMADSFFDRFSAQVTPVAAAPASERLFPAPPSEEVAHPVLPPANPPSAVSVFALVPREPFGLPMVAWIGGVIYLFIVILVLGSLI